MINCKTVTVKERFIISEALNRAVDDAGSAYFILKGMEERMVRPDFCPEEEIFSMIGTLHAAAGMIHNLILSYAATVTGESITGTDFFEGDLKDQQNSMYAYSTNKSLTDLLNCQKNCTMRDRVKDLPAEEAVNECLKMMSV